MLPKGVSPLIDGYNAAVGTEIVWGTITGVNSEKQTIKVLFGDSHEEFEMPINQALSIGGAGIRFMPIPGQTKAIVHSKNNINTHLGYFVDNAEAVTDSKTGKKQSGFLLQRYLEPGEIQFLGIGYNEIFFEKSGNIYIKSGSQQYILLNDIDSLFEVQAGTIKFELDEVRIRSGNIRRPINTITNEDDNVTKESGNSTVYYKEFSVSVGTKQGDDTKDYQEQVPTAIDGSKYPGRVPVDQFPYDGFMSLASRVYNDRGTEEKVFDKFLKYLLKFPVGISISVDEEGSFVIKDQTNNNFMRIKVGYDIDSKVPLTEFEVKINKSDLKINSDGEFVYTLQDPTEESDSIKKKVSVSFKKDTSVELKQTIDGEKFNTILMDTAGIKVSDLNDSNVIELTTAGTSITDKNKNSIVCDDSGVTVTDKSSNKITTSSAGTEIEDKNSNKITMSSSGIIAKDKNSNELIMDASGITLKTGDAITWKPNILPACIFSNAPHCTIIKLKGA